MAELLFLNYQGLHAPMRVNFDTRINKNLREKFEQMAGQIISFCNLRINSLRLRIQFESF